MQYRLKEVLYFVFIFFKAYISLHAACTSFPNIKPVQNSHTIAVIGTGYVGLVCGAGFAELGHRVICVDIDSEKIQQLQNGIIPIYEPGLEELVQKNVNAQRLFFTSDIHNALRKSEVIFIAVGTPAGSDGQADLSFVKSAAKQIAPYLDPLKTLCLKSTVPIGTCRQIKQWIEEDLSDGQGLNIVFNPEFLREGSAIHDFFFPDRIVLGILKEHSKTIMDEIYEPLASMEIPFVYTSLESAEAIKYASNAFLAVKISFINEFAHLCDATGADVLEVASGIGLDKRIGLDFLKPGPGYGGSCFPKDTLALLQTARNSGFDLKIVRAAVEANEEQKQRVLQKARRLLNDSFKNKNVCILGLSFKPDTDDVREAPSIAVIQGILSEGGLIQAYDPEASQNMRKLFPQISYMNDPYQAAQNADVLILLTDWDEFRSMDLPRIHALMRNPSIVDARNILNTSVLKALGFKIANIGRPNVLH